MKYIVGYQQNAAFIDSIIENKAHIKELYFSWGDLPNGRASVATTGGVTAYERQAALCADLARISTAGIKMNWLLNANCYGHDSQSRAFFCMLGDTADYIKRTFGLSTVTTSSILIAKFFRENFPELDVRASVNMEIGNPEGLAYVRDYFTSFYIKRECNRNRKALDAVRDICRANGKSMYLLANSGCLNFCSAHTFHDNLVAHEAEIATMDNGYQFGGICHDYLRTHPEDAIRNTNYIRPEDIGLYERYTDAVKLATRVNQNPTAVLVAYIKGHYAGGVNRLLEPDHSGVLYPTLLENSKFPTEFAERVMTCDKNCTQCGYCVSVYHDIKINLGEMKDADK